MDVTTPEPARSPSHGHGSTLETTGTQAAARRLGSAAALTSPPARFLRDAAFRIGGKAPLFLRRPMMRLGAGNNPAEERFLVTTQAYRSKE